MLLLSLYDAATNVPYYNVRLCRAAEEEPHRAEGKVAVRSLVIPGYIPVYITV